MDRATVKIDVGGDVRGTPDDVEALLTDYENYDCWWPLPVEVSGSAVPRLRVTVLPFVELDLEPMMEVEGGTVGYRYVRGPFRGTGVWDLQPRRGQEPLTGVRYRIELRPVNGLVRWISRTRLFRRRHTADINGILRAMEAELSTE